MAIAALQRVGVVFEALYGWIAIMASLLWVGVIYGITQTRKEKSESSEVSVQT